ncbi:hypothetical protein PVAND_013050 [Polypedilum vanderplanki]|uniref:Uncharacterized protein n=1 Tax=Polypedilum vanderplanki TaxID=319348 RepID=A0A9J6CNB2_POLVA|nr:hypothetical protein PVAND_013050 [Polypedilum vanderplanki]
MRLALCLFLLISVQILLLNADKKVKDKYENNEESAAMIQENKFQRYYGGRGGCCNCCSCCGCNGGGFDYPSPFPPQQPPIGNNPNPGMPMPPPQIPPRPANDPNMPVPSPEGRADRSVESRETKYSRKGYRRRSSSGSSKSSKPYEFI